MSKQLIAEPATNWTLPQANDERDNGYCPECGQTLDVARHREIPTKRRTLEPFVVLIFGLCLTVAFAPRAWNTQLGLDRFDQEVASLRSRADQGTFPRPDNPTMFVRDATDAMSDVLTTQQAVRLRFERELTGLGFGIFTLIVGAVSWLLERPEVGAGQRTWTIPGDLSAAVRRQVGGNPWDLGVLVAITLVRITLLLFVIVVGLQLIRGVPPSLELLDQALTRVVILVVTIASALS